MELSELVKFDELDIDYAGWTNEMSSKCLYIYIYLYIYINIYIYTCTYPNAPRIPPGRSVGYVGLYCFIPVSGHAKIHTEKVRLKVPQCAWYFLWGRKIKPKRYDRKYHSESGTFSGVFGKAFGLPGGSWGSPGWAHGDACDSWIHQHSMEICVTGQIGKA